VGDAGKRQSCCIKLGRFLEVVVVPCGLLAVAGDALAVEVVGDGGPVDVVFEREFAHGGAGSVGLNEVVDVGGGKASLGRV
jgi:hypothetical protein